MLQQSKNVYITGINSFTGRYLVPELEKSDFTVVNSPKKLPALETSIDLLDLKRLNNSLREKQPDYIIHLAGITTTTHPDPTTYYETNVIGTLNLLKSINNLKKTPRHIIIASSANIYGNQSAEIINENMPLNPINHYAASKVAMEFMVNQWRTKLPITIVRPFNYTGVGQTENFLIPKIIKHYKEKASLIKLGNLDIYRDFSDVRFVVNAYTHLLDNERTIGRIINICSGRSHSIRDILGFCEKHTGHAIRVDVDPFFVRENEVKNLRGDSSLLNFFLPHLPQISIEDTLRWMLDAEIKEGFHKC